MDKAGPAVEVAPPESLRGVPRSRYDLDKAQLAELLEGQPRFRLDQIWEALYSQGKEPAQMSNLPRSLRQQLDHAAPPALRVSTESSADNGETVKTLWALADGVLVESVLMHYRDHTTVCVSTQAGCAMGCGFCATGQAGFHRHLSAGEIIEQVIRARHRALATHRRLSNVVFMGMGEPLANYDRVWTALRRLHGDMGLSARHLTVSTVGLVAGIRRMASEPEPVNLAVSLHAADDALRNQLVPINQRYPLDELMDACAQYLAAKNRRLSFEWAMIDGVNDRGQDAVGLAARARPLRAHVNLIPLNATPGYPTTGTPPARVAAFRERLIELGVNATIRRNRGSDIDAACGQLAARPQTLDTPVAAPARRAVPRPASGAGAPLPTGT